MNKDGDNNLGGRTVSAVTSDGSCMVLRLLLETVSTSGGWIDKARHVRIETPTSVYISCHAVRSLYDVLVVSLWSWKKESKKVATNKFYGRADRYDFRIAASSESNKDLPLRSSIPVWFARPILFLGLPIHILLWISMMTPVSPQIWKTSNLESSGSCNSWKYFTQEQLPWAQMESDWNVSGWGEIGQRAIQIPFGSE